MEDSPYKKKLEANKHKPVDKELLAVKKASKDKKVKEKKIVKKNIEDIEENEDDE